MNVSSTTDIRRTPTFAVLQLELYIHEANGSYMYLIYLLYIYVSYLSIVYIYQATWYSAYCNWHSAYSNYWHLAYSNWSFTCGRLMFYTCILHIYCLSGYVIFSVLQLELEIQRSRDDPEYTRSPSLFNERETRMFLVLFFFCIRDRWVEERLPGSNSDCFFLFAWAVLTPLTIVPEEWKKDQDSSSNSSAPEKERDWTEGA